MLRDVLKFKVDKESLVYMMSKQIGEKYKSCSLVYPTFSKRMVLVYLTSMMIALFSGFSGRLWFCFVAFTMLQVGLGVINLSYNLEVTKPLIHPSIS